MEERHLNNIAAHKKLYSFILTLLVTIIVWNLPTSMFHIDGLTVVQQRIIAIFVFATLSWLTEAVPSWATSLAIIASMCLTVSNNALTPFKGEGQGFGELLSAKAIMASFADPVNMLFLGGFILAIAASKYGLDVLLARKMLKPFGNKSENVLLGFLLITGLFSMFVSNTATAAMMLTFLTPVFAAMPANGKGRIALTLSIPVAANLGGMGTPIGTPPNAIALQQLGEMGMSIDFGQWMMMMMPLVALLLFLSWRVILWFFPFTKKTIDLEITGYVHRGWKMWVVSGTFILTILLWVIPKDYTGIDSNTVALVPMAIFALTGVIGAKDLQEINWSVIWMVAGGFALGIGLNSSGLADAAIESIPFGEWSPIVILLVSGIICYVLSNFISNTATAALLAPILATVCKGMGSSLDTIGGTTTILVGLAVAASSAMCLPISTPPNAIAFSTGLVKQNDMLKIGITVGILTMALGYAMLFTIGKLHLLG
ncbi:MAG: SLC13/DASS family transporter [Alloprevotella sp.]|nr:SLC13/DASS family transporter [Alloprevotella sp.]